jgi:hypothetical protein
MACCPWPGVGPAGQSGTGAAGRQGWIASGDSTGAAYPGLGGGLKGGEAKGLGSNEQIQTKAVGCITSVLSISLHQTLRKPAVLLRPPPPSSVLLRPPESPTPPHHMRAMFSFRYEAARWTHRITLLYQSAPSDSECSTGGRRPPALRRS